MAVGIEKQLRFLIMIVLLAEAELLSTGSNPSSVSGSDKVFDQQVLL